MLQAHAVTAGQIALYLRQHLCCMISQHLISSKSSNTTLVYTELCDVCTAAPSSWPYSLRCQHNQADQHWYPLLQALHSLQLLLGDSPICMEAVGNAVGSSIGSSTLVVIGSVIVFVGDYPALVHYAI